MTVDQLCKNKEETLFGPVVKLGSRKECGICGAMINCSRVITAKSKKNKSHESFFCCRACLRSLNSTHHHLISEEYFYKTVKELRNYKTITFVDIETSGLLQEGGEIIEIGALSYRISRAFPVRGLFFKRIKPSRDYMNPEAEKVHHISLRSLEDCPTLEQVLPEFLGFITDSLVVAHRAHFDMGFINVACDELGLPRPNNPVLDSFEIGKKLYHTPVCLDDLLKRNKIRIPFSRHKSYIDCLTTSEVFFKMVRWYSLDELSPRPFREIEYIGRKE